MDTLGDTLAKKATVTLRDSRASKIEGRHHLRHTRNDEGKRSARCTNLHANTGITVEKEVERHGKALAKVKV